MGSSLAWGAEPAAASGEAPAPAAQVAPAGNPTKQELEAQLKATQAQLEAMQKQLEGLRQSLQVPPPPPPPPAPTVVPTPELDLDRVMQEAREAREEAQREADRARNDALKGALEAREEAAVLLEKLSEELESKAGQSGEGAREASRELRDRIREARNQLRDAERMAREARRSAGGLDIIGETEGNQGERLVLGSNTSIRADEEVPELVVLGGNADVLGKVTGDAVVMGGNLKLRKGSSVGGDVLVFGGSFDREEGATVKGDVVRLSSLAGVPTLVKGKADVKAKSGGAKGPDEEVRSHSHDDEHSGGFFASLKRAMVGWLVLIAGGLLCMSYVPRRLKSVSAIMEKRLAASAAVGLLASLALAPVTVLMVVTVVGILAVPFLYGLLFIGYFAGMTSLALVLAQRLPLRGGPRTPGGKVLWGMGLLVVSFLLPKLGALLMVATAMVSVGAVLLSRFGTVEEPV